MLSCAFGRMCYPFQDDEPTENHRRTHGVQFQFIRLHSFTWRAIRQHIVLIGKHNKMICELKTKVMNIIQLISILFQKKKLCFVLVNGFTLQSVWKVLHRVQFTVTMRVLQIIQFFFLFRAILFRWYMVDHGHWWQSKWYCSCFSFILSISLLLILVCKR